ncbi:MAG: hypothetical protein AAGJ35_05125, partial [Myxococcota bacterium]
MAAYWNQVRWCWLAFFVLCRLGLFVLCIGLWGCEGEILDVRDRRSVRSSPERLGHTLLRLWMREAALHPDLGDARVAVLEQRRDILTAALDAWFADDLVSLEQYAHALLPLFDDRSIPLLVKEGLDVLAELRRDRNVLKAWQKQLMHAHRTRIFREEQHMMTTKQHSTALHHFLRHPLSRQALQRTMYWFSRGVRENHVTFSKAIEHLGTYWLSFSEQEQETWFDFLGRLLFVRDQRLVQKANAGRTACLGCVIARLVEGGHLMVRTDAFPSALTQWFLDSVQRLRLLFGRPNPKTHAYTEQAPLIAALPSKHAFSGWVVQTIDASAVHCPKTTASMPTETHLCAPSD